MEVTIVTTSAERDEMMRTLDGYTKFVYGELAKDRFLRDYPRKVWIDTEMCRSHNATKLPFLVVDNRGDECWCEDFATLDGAVLYATDVYMTPRHKKDWDYPDAVKDGGSIRYRLEEGDASPERKA